MRHGLLDSNHPAVLHSQRRRARVEIIPLIDVMFLLVAFFMVISISMVLQEGIAVNLSTADTGEAMAREESSLTITVAADGNLFLQKEAIGQSQLQRALVKEAAQRPETSVTINADQDALHGDVVAILDLVRRVGLTNVVIAVEPKN